MTPLELPTPEALALTVPHFSPAALDHLVGQITPLLPPPPRRGPKGMPILERVRLALAHLREGVSLRGLARIKATFLIFVLFAVVLAGVVKGPGRLDNSSLMVRRHVTSPGTEPRSRCRTYAVEQCSATGDRGGVPPGDLETAFGDVVRDLRERKGLSQEELGFACGRHRTYVSLIERGRNSPSLRTIWLISIALEVDPAELLRQVVRKNPSP